MELLKSGNNGLMDMSQAAEYLNLKKSSLYQLSMKKAIPVVKIGRRNRFRKSDLDNFINKNVVEVVEG